MKKLISVLIICAMVASLSACAEGGAKEAITSTEAAKTSVIETSAESNKTEEPEETEAPLVSEAAKPLETANAAISENISAENISAEDISAEDISAENASSEDISAEVSAVSETAPIEDVNLETEEELPDTPPLQAGDITIEILYNDGETKITTDTERFTLDYTYVGSAEYAEYCFGCYFELEKLVDGEWVSVPFAENAGFIDLGYLIGTFSTKSSTEVYLGDDFYAEPLTAGDYRVVKYITDIRYDIEFTISEPEA